MRFQRDGEHLISIRKRELFPGWWIDCVGSNNWPPWSPDLIPLHFRVYGYVKNMENECQRNRREELHHGISMLQDL
jgi:hypothetical protein